MATASPATAIRAWQGTYRACPRHVRDARHAVEEFLSGCAAADETLLICSELTTNSVLHSRSKDDGKFTLRVTVYAGYLWIECEDAWWYSADAARATACCTAWTWCTPCAGRTAGAWRTWIPAGPAAWCGPGWSLTGAVHDLACLAAICGPITAGCPASCLASVISLMALNRLLHACDAPQTVGDAGRLCRDGKLTSDTFRYLGPRRRSEIEAGLVLAGFDVSHCVRDGEVGATRQ